MLLSKLSKWIKFIDEKTFDMHDIHKNWKQSYELR